MPALRVYYEVAHLQVVAPNTFDMRIRLGFGLFADKRIRVENSIETRDAEALRYLGWLQIFLCSNARRLQIETDPSQFFDTISARVIVLAEDAPDHLTEVRDGSRWIDVGTYTHEALNKRYDTATVRGHMRGRQTTGAA